MNGTRHSLIASQSAEVAFKVELLRSGYSVQHILVKLTLRRLTVCGAHIDASDVRGLGLVIPFECLERGVHQLHQVAEEALRVLSRLPVPHNVVKFI